MAVYNIILRFSHRFSGWNVHLSFIIIPLYWYKIIHMWHEDKKKGKTSDIMFFTTKNKHRRYFSYGDNYNRRDEISSKSSWVRIASIYCREKKKRQHPKFFICAAILRNALNNKYISYGLPSKFKPLALKNSSANFL